MGDVEDLDFIRSQMTTVRWHLECATAPEAGQQVNHLEAARRAYEATLELLPLLKLSGTKRVELVNQLAKLREQLRQTGMAL